MSSSSAITRVTPVTGNLPCPLGPGPWSGGARDPGLGQQGHFSGVPACFWMLASWDSWTAKQLCVAFWLLTDVVPVLSSCPGLQLRWHLLPSDLRASLLRGRLSHGWQTDCPAWRQGRSCYLLLRKIAQRLLGDFLASV